MDIRIFPPDGLPEATIELPRSKSVNNRALIMQALAPAGCRIDGMADCDDVKVMTEILSQGKDVTRANVGLAGTAMRFLTAYFAASEGFDVELDGNDRMRRRPIGQLVDALRSIGASIEYTGEEGYPPLRIKGRSLKGGSVNVGSDISSQFVTALLLIAPVCKEGLTLILEGETVSRPYIDLTVGMMRRQGIEVDVDGNIISVAPGEYSSSPIEVEADWTAASYWYEISALSAGWIDLEGLSPDSLQGDRAVAAIFRRICVDTEWDEDTPSLAHLSPNPDQAPRFNADLSGNPDIAQTLAVTLCMLNIPFRLSGIANLRVKETDRLEALRVELMKVGFMLEVERDALVWEGERVPARGIPSIDTYGDHRMAMAFAPMSIFIPALEIKNAEVVTKSYPRFWDDLIKAGFRIAESDKLPEDFRRMLEEQ